MAELEITQQPLPDPNQLYNQGKEELGNLRSLKVGEGSSIFFTDQEGSRWGHPTFDGAKAYIKIDGSYKFKADDGTVLLDSLGGGGNFVNVINSALNTASKTILTDFTFESTDYAGAFKAGNPTWDEITGLITGGSGVLINARGILGANAGVATFTLDATTGNATFSGTITGSSIIGGTIIGGTIKTATPGLATGSAVVIEGGNNQIIKLYYNTVNVGTISGLQTTIGAETEYLKIAASSGRFISIRGSEIAFDADLVQSGTHDVGQQAQPWHAMWAETMVAWKTGGGGKFSCQGSNGVDSSTKEYITSMRWNDNGSGRIATYNGGRTDLQYKVRSFTFVGGILTGMGSESGWRTI